MIHSAALVPYGIVWLFSTILLRGRHTRALVVSALQKYNMDNLRSVVQMMVWLALI